MGVRGPVPKRSEQRIRRNKDETPIDSVTEIGPVEIPALDLEDPHPLIVDFYNSLADSGQAQYYEPSDWQYARFTMHFADKLIKSGKPSSQMLAAVNTALSDLLVSEGHRRRVRMEVEREQTNAQLADVASLFADRLAQ